MKEGRAKENLYFYHSVLLKFKYHLNNVNLLKNISIFKLKGKNVLHFKLNAQKEGIIYLYKYKNTFLLLTFLYLTNYLFAF